MIQAPLATLVFDREAFRQTPLSPVANFGPPTFLYLMQCEHFTKVGIASNTQARKNSLQRSNPFKVRILYSKRFDAKMFALIAERGVHHVLAAWQHSGEWFTATPQTAKDAIRLVCAEMPFIISRHQELDMVRREARSKRDAAGSTRRVMHTQEADELWGEHKAKTMAHLFPDAALSPSPSR